MSEWAVEKRHSRQKRKAQKRKGKTGRSDQRGYKRRKLDVEIKKKSNDFHVDLKYRFSLPSPVGHPKLLQVRLPPNYATRYSSSELECQRSWSLFSESGLIVPLDVWDPSAYESNKSDNATRAVEDDKLLDMIYARTTKQQNKINANVREKAKNASFFLNPFLLTRIKHVRKPEGKTHDERGTIFAEENSSLKALRDQQNKVLSVDYILKTFQDIDSFQPREDEKPIEHPTKPGLTLKSSLPIFPDDRLLKNNYSHISFVRTPAKEVMKLSFMETIEDEVAYESARNSTIKVSQHGFNKKKKWFSYYAPVNKQPEEALQEHEWTSEFKIQTKERKKKGEAQRIFFVESKQSGEIVWGKLSERILLRRGETDPVSTQKTGSVMSLKERDIFSNLPKSLTIEEVDEFDD